MKLSDRMVDCLCDARGQALTPEEWERRWEIYASRLGMEGESLADAVQLVLDVCRPADAEPRGSAVVGRPQGDRAGEGVAGAVERR